MYQIITLYTLNLHKIVCQLYLKAGGKKEFSNHFELTENENVSVSEKSLEQCWRKLKTLNSY